VSDTNTSVFRDAVVDDFEGLLVLYGQLNPDDDASPTAALRAGFESILQREGLRLLVLEADGVVVATTYLNVIPNLTRGGSPYAVIENVVVDRDKRGRGLGKRLMAETLSAAWSSGCYKAMLHTGSNTESTHAFYRSCGFSPHDKTAYVARPIAGAAGEL
jgi:GNAT superfamily N-acetyltransferase